MWEIIRMSIFEYNKEEEKKLRKAEYEAGVEHTSIEIAKRMLKSGKLSLNEIADYCSLSIEKIKELNI